MSDRRPDKRRFHRVLYRAQAQLTDALGQVYPCEVVDLSLRGCLLEFPDPPALDADGLCLLTLPLDPEHIIRMWLSPVHRRGPRLGLVCHHTDLASFTCLRRLVELNLGNPKLLERDLEALCGLR